MPPYSINYNYIQFYVYDYTNTPTLSTYTLGITPLKFVPDFTTSTLLSAAASISNTYIHWDFGDGSFSTDISPTHTYEWPGVYPVTLTIYDGNGNAYDSSYQPSVTAYDYIPTQFGFQPFNNTALSAKYQGPFRVNTINSWQLYNTLSAAGQTINFYASGAGSAYESAADYNANKWSHLISSNQFYALEKVYGNNQFVAVDSLSAFETPIYTNIVNGQLQICGQNDPGATLAGTSGYCDVYYSDDSIADYISNSPTYLFATTDSSYFNDAFTQRTNIFNFVDYNPPNGYQNIAPAVISIQKTNYSPASALKFSTNGITGEGPYPSNVFYIPQINWQGTQIPFVITIKDANNYTTKFYPPLSSSSLNPNLPPTLSAFNLSISVVQRGSGNSWTTVVSNVSSIMTEDFEADTPQSLGSFYRAYFTPNFTGNNFALSANMKVVDSVRGTYTIYGRSNTFNIYSSAGAYNISKVNENWDASGYYKSLRFQEPLINYDMFFTDFLGSIVGDANSYPYELGKTIYEKIANFVGNKSDIDTSNLDALLSMCNELAIQYEQYNYSYPPQLRRLIDLISIKQQKLWGSQNQYNINFNNNIQLYTDRSIGPNRGTVISPITGRVTAGKPVVAYELFSGNYTLVNYTSGGTLTGKNVPLSTFTTDWGWGLIVPNGLTGKDVSNYYTFYTFISGIDGTIYDNIIDWNNTYTQLTSANNNYSNWSTDDGIMQNMISYELTKSLGLFPPDVQIALS
jgi:hypothetical protein